MKLKYTVLIALSSALLFGLIFISSCKKIENVAEGVKLIIDYNLVQTTVDVQFYDAATGELIGRNGDASVNVKITGPDQDGVMDITGVQNENRQYSSQRGIMGLALIPEAAYTPSESRPVVFNMVTDLPGYLTTSQKVTIVSEGRNQFKVNMVRLDNPPQGVSVNRETGVTDAIDGRIQNPATVSTPTGRAKIEIPADIVIRDSGGNPLSGSINVDVIHFDNTDEEALAAFPGGLMPTVTRTDGTVADGMFYSAGFVAIEITDASGRQAATFENGTVRMEAVVSPETFNPETNSPVAAGDIVPVWSYDENTGEWTEEGFSTMQLVNGQLVADFPLTHLSYYNFDWFYGDYCYQGAAFQFVPDNPITGCFLMQGTMYRQDDNAYLMDIFMWICPGESVYTNYAPSGVPVKIVWGETNYPNIEIAPASQPTLINDLCASSPIQIDLIHNTNSNTTTITIDVEAFCSSEPSVIIRPSFSAWYRNLSGWNWLPITMENGYTEIMGVEVGETYMVGIYYDNQWYETEVLVTAEDYTYVGIELPAEVCDEVFGY